MELPDLFYLQAKQGDVFELFLVYLENDEVTPVPLVGYSVEFSLAVALGGAPNFTYTQEDYITLGGVSGEIHIEVPHTETRDWDARRYFYEISITSPSNKKLTVLEGRIGIRPEVVRD